MQPRDKGKASEPTNPGNGEKKRRFQIIKLEERLAPAGGGNTKKHCGGGSSATESVTTSNWTSMSY